VLRRGPDRAAAENAEPSSILFFTSVGDRITVLEARNLG